jgi:signal transduction histidine kinase
MRERALLTGGQLTVASRPGDGTRVRLALPRPPEDR